MDLYQGHLSAGERLSLHAEACTEDPRDTSPFLLEGELLTLQGDKHPSLEVRAGPLEISMAVNGLDVCCLANSTKAVQMIKVFQYFTCRLMILCIFVACLCICRQYMYVFVFVDKFEIFLSVECCFIY